jgi:hypothetical protein
MNTIYIDPPYKVYFQNKLFDLTDSTLNRDDTLSPFAEVRSIKNNQGQDVHTADYLIEIVARGDTPANCHYYSLGALENFRKFRGIKNVKFESIAIFEPPVVDSRPYEILPELTSTFKKVFLHNTLGDGYSLSDVNQSRLRKLYWPLYRKQVIEEYWQNKNRLNKVVVINGNHRPINKNCELYSSRIKAMMSLAKYNCIDLYGRGWSRWYSRSSMWLPYLLNYGTLMSIYKGHCESKYETLSNYKFCLCFENMEMGGYVTEKIFDCFYAGTIPLYLGASDIEKIIPVDTFIDCRRFSCWKDLHDFVMTLSNTDIEIMKFKGKKFIESDLISKHNNFLKNFLI